MVSVRSEHLHLSQACLLDHLRKSGRTGTRAGFQREGPHCKAPGSHVVDSEVAQVVDSRVRSQLRRDTENSGSHINL